MLITLSQRTAICQSVAEVQLTGGNCKPQIFNNNNNIIIIIIIIITIFMRKEIIALLPITEMKTVLVN